MCICMGVCMAHSCCMSPAYVCVDNVGVCIAGSSVGKSVTEEEGRKRVCACMCCLCVVWKCMSKRLETCTKVRVGDVVYSHKILVVGMGMLLSTHGGSQGWLPNVRYPM